METPARPSLSDAETSVLRVLWEEGPGTVRSVSESFVARGGKRWAYTTVQTLLQRLKTKGYVEAEAGEGSALVYTATTDRHELIRDRLRDLADEFCEGAPAPLVLTLVENHKFSPEEIARFRALLDRNDPAAASDKRPGRPS